MTLYLQMPIAPNNPVYTFENFKARYLELTGEKIQNSPRKNNQGTHYLVGSSRLTQEVADQLASEFPMVNITPNFPSGWEGEDSE